MLAKSFESSVIPYAFIIKLLLTSITLATGFQGGEVTPLFVIGATLGNFLANIVGLPISFLAGIGMIGVFCGGNENTFGIICYGTSDIWRRKYKIYICGMCYKLCIFWEKWNIYITKKYNDRIIS